MVQFHPLNSQISKWSKTNKILTLRSRNLEQGYLLSPPAPFLFLALIPPLPGAPLPECEQLT
jgi:hypothetical protein